MMPWSLDEAARQRAEALSYACEVRELAKHCARLSGTPEPEYQATAIAFKALHQGTVLTWRQALGLCYAWADTHAGVLDWTALARVAVAAR